MIRLAIIISILLFTAECGKRENGSLKLPDRPIAVARPEIAILQYDASKHAALFHDVMPSSLSNDELQTLDSILSKCIEDYNSNLRKASADSVTADTGIRQIDMSKYSRQYITVLNASNEKEAYVNCFCQVQDNNYWRKAIISVEDGGICYFSVRVNMSTRICYDLTVNGDA